MTKKLLIVESPSKASTIKKFLGKDYEVIASFGHVRDLPKKEIGIDIEDNFKPKYQNLADKKDVISKIKSAAKKVDEILLASDPDREGEAIAWHIANILKIENKKSRVEFNEITKEKIKGAVLNPRKIDQNKVDAQQARRMLDRLVGYKISPLLWKILGGNTSAGRVQSVALKIICDLEDKINNFIVEDYWEVFGKFNEEIELKLNKIKNKTVSKIKDKKVVKTIENKVKVKSEFLVKSKTVKEKAQRPPMPLKTSTLQQLASSNLGFSVSRTMKVAQELYEGIQTSKEQIGLITYMRTDSQRISDEAIKNAKKYIEKNYGKQYIGNFKNVNSKKKIQDAHEAIRPTYIDKNPDSISAYLSSDQYKLYKLIWERFLISQFSNMEYRQHELIVERDEYSFKGTFNKITFDGYYKIFKNEEDIKDVKIPDIKENDKIILTKLDIKASQTKPPSRLSEASLVKKLEADGIGRPSTYAAIIFTLKKREYVKLEKKTFFPTILGIEVKSAMEKYFPNIMNIKFTAIMEDSLDEIEQGEKEWKKLLGKFYETLAVSITNYEEDIKKIKLEGIQTNLKCICEKPLRLKIGRYGKYLECSDYENCKTRVKVPDSLKKYVDKSEENNIIFPDDITIEAIRKEFEAKITDVVCEQCNVNMGLKKGKYGNYIECEKCNTKKSIPKSIRIDTNNKDIIELKEQLDIIRSQEQEIIKNAGKCDKCGSDWAIKMGKYGKFLACSSYPKCKNIKKISKKSS